MNLLFKGAGSENFLLSCRVSASVQGQERLSHALMQCTVGFLYYSACAVIYIFHICTRDHAYSDRLQT